MHLLIIEDNDEKYDDIRSVVESTLAGNNLEITRASFLSEAQRDIYQTKFDLMIVDLMLPKRAEGNAEDISDEVLELINMSEINRHSNAIAITSFIELRDSCSRSFNEFNISIVSYSSTDAGWKDSLVRELNTIENASIFEFAIVCALEKEREAFRYSNAEVGDRRLIRGLDCLDITISGKKGIVVKPPRMGMTDAAIVTTQLLDAFHPSIICMSGICAGIPGKSEIGDLIIAESCFDYQVGKWTKSGFEYELYQVPIAEDVRGRLSQSLLNDQLNAEIRIDLEFPELLKKEIKFVTHASGSAVVADKAKRDEITAMHRKLASVEMEIYSLYRAASVSVQKPLFFAIKGVVDDAGASKGDKYHLYGATSSARLVVAALETLL
jgi:nucleoside phosphorylase/CheY-like chemotaxis protein